VFKMSTGQWRVLILLMFLLGLEIVRSDKVRTFFSGVYQGFSTPATHPGIGGTSQGVPTVQGTPPQPGNGGIKVHGPKGVY
jgi:hypothetical protein